MPRKEPCDTGTAALSRVWVEIEHLETVESTVCDSHDGHRCENWDAAARYVIEQILAGVDDGSITADDVFAV